VSWQLVAFAVVMVALGACFAWFERTRPSSKVVAVVATMAALTALGRDAFAAIPDVKPTTAMVFVCGYVFGPAPGFAIGAVGALASNVALGEGPWTPWQMFAWGAVAIAGALIGRVTGLRLGRLALAFACALAAGGFNLVMDAYTWTLSGSHTLAAYVTVLAAGLTFDLTHVVASFAFGWAFGPALARMLTRVRARLDVRWGPVGALSLTLLLAVTVAGGVSAGSIVAPDRASASAPGSQAAAVAYLRAAQNTDGGWGAASGQASSGEFSAWTAMGLAAVGVDPASVVRNGRTVIDALHASIGQLSGAGDLERTILALHAARAPPTSFAGRDLVAELLHYRSPDGSFEHLSNTTAFAVFAFSAAGRGPGDAVLRGAGRWLAGQQNSDGGFGFGGRGLASDVDDTAAVLQGMVDVSPSTSSLARGVSFLRRQQNADGGFPLQPGGDSNAQSTAWAVQALLACRVNPAAVRRGAGPSPLDYLHRLIGSDGSVRYSSASSQTPVWVTAQALIALGAKSFPVPPTAVGAGAALGVSQRAGHVAGHTGGAPARVHAYPKAATGHGHGALQRAGPVGQAAVGPRARLVAAHRRLVALARATGTLAGMVLGPMVG
jgi:energy-coupling factor transport system substrate-specific component